MKKSGNEPRRPARRPPRMRGKELAARLRTNESVRDQSHSNGSAVTTKQSPFELA